MACISNDIDIHSLGTVRLRAYWILDQVGDQDGRRLSDTEIAKTLVDVYGISTSPQAVNYALKTAGNSVNKNKEGYKLMHKGRQELQGTSTYSGGTMIIEPNKPYTAKRTLSTIFSELKGDVCICDPFVDSRTLDVIADGLDQNLRVKLLTQKVTDKTSGGFGRSLIDLKKEGFAIEVRINKKSDIHDRYILDSKHFWYSGNSLNHLGEKESMLIALGEDTRDSVRRTFEERWKTAVPYR